jgi:copper chaperone CopZ
MFRSAVRWLIVASVLAAASDSIARAANPATTTIRVKDMHCEGCAAKIRRGLFSVAGVVNVTTNVKAHTAFVSPQRNRQPSPRAMWEAVEKAGFEVVQLHGPGGAFTEKPQR